MNKSNAMKRLWKRVSVALIAGVLTIALMGCSLDDLFSSFNLNDLPFEEETTPTDMGVVDDRPVIPDDANFDDLRYDPL